MDPAIKGGEEGAARLALASVLLIALLQSVWNALRVPALTGYDEPGHLAYIFTLVREARLPDPLAGWSTFHPPLYYAAASLLCRLADSASPYAQLLCLRSLGVAAAVICGAVAFQLVRGQRNEVSTATVAALLALFLPFRQLATTMIGNEAVAAALVAVALLFLIDLQREPGRLGRALAVGVFTGLALDTKYSAVALLPACVIPFLRTDLGARGRRAAVACGLAIALIAGPVYARNLALTGRLFPMTRDLEPMRSIEHSFALRARRASDYLFVPWGVIRNPSIAGESFDGIPGPPIHIQKEGQTLEVGGRVLNRHMISVAGLVYAGVWWDPFEVRVPPQLHSAGSWLGTALTLLGVVPSVLVIAGFFVATRRLLSTGLRAAEAPVTLFAGCALALFVIFTWRAPSLVAAKASYLLPVGVPAALFFADGVASLGPRVRSAALAVSLVAALACAVAFTDGVLFNARAADPLVVGLWTRLSAFLPGQHLDEAVMALRRVPVVNGAP